MAKLSKSSNERLINRFKKYYSVNIDLKEIKDINRSIAEAVKNETVYRSNFNTFMLRILSRASHKITLWRIHYKDSFYVVVFDEATSTVRTILPNTHNLYAITIYNAIAAY